MDPVRRRFSSDHFILFEDEIAEEIPIELLKSGVIISDEEEKKNPKLIIKVSFLI
jgi:hypothetical protein